MNGFQKCPVYLKLLFLGKVSENFAKRVYEEVSQVFGSVRLRTVLYTYRPLSEIYKDASPIQEKVTSFTNLVTTSEKHLKGFIYG